MIYLICGYRRHGKDTFFSMVKSGKDPDFPPGKRVSIADELKKKTHKKLKLTDTNVMKEYKDKIWKNGKSLRDYYRETSRKYKEKDKYYWVRNVLPLLNYEDDFYITDWRFRYEKEFLLRQGFDITTIRVTRENGVIPPKDEIEEHDIDDVETDYIIQFYHPQ